jgi:hypothetical protein
MLDPQWIEDELATNPCPVCMYFAGGKSSPEIVPWKKVYTHHDYLGYLTESLTLIYTFPEFWVVEKFTRTTLPAEKGKERTSSTEEVYIVTSDKITKTDGDILDEDADAAFAKFANPRDVKLAYEERDHIVNIIRFGVEKGEKTLDIIKKIEDILPKFGMGGGEGGAKAPPIPE